MRSPPEVSTPPGNSWTAAEKSSTEQAVKGPAFMSTVFTFFIILLEGHQTYSVYLATIWSQDLTGPVGQVCRSNTETSGLRSNTETPGLQFKQWDPWSAVQILRPKVWSSNIEIPGLQLMKCRPGLSVFEPQTLVLSIWASDLGSHCLNCRPGVSLFELQTRGLTVWTTDLGSQYLITDLRSQYLTCRPGYRSR